jgi:Protein of unknown function (DUF1045)
MAAARYALYLAPPPDTPLWAFGSRVLGYDAATGLDVPGFAPRHVAPDAWAELTERPRLYGFHATLKAPFALAAGGARTDLEEALAAFCLQRSSFDLGPLAVQALAIGEGPGFAALVQTRPSPELEALERDAVVGFDRFRAPPTDDEILRRKPERLSSRQRDSLLRYGYPFLGPDYRFHMTLSGATPEAAEVADRLADAMANAIGPAHLRVDAIVLFTQPAPGVRFRIARRFAFGRAEAPAALLQAAPART